MNGTDEITHLSYHQMVILSYLNGVTSSLSVIGGGSIISCAIFKCRALTAEIQPIFQLSLADVLASLCLLISVALFNSGRTYDIVCSYMATLTGGLYVTTFLLTVLYSAEVYMRMKQRNSLLYNFTKDYEHNHIRCGKITYILIWVIPTLLGIIMVIIYGPENGPVLDTLDKVLDSEDLQCKACLPLFQYNEDYCFQHEESVRRWHIAGKFLFLVPLLSSMIMTGVFYLLAVYAFKETNVMSGVLGVRQYREEKRIKNKALLYQCVFIWCWLPALILGIVSITPVFNMGTFFWLYIVQACTAPLQGFLNCIIYGWQREGFKQALYEQTEHSPLNSDLVPDYNNYSL